MRTAFVDTLVHLARRDPRVLLLTGDLGFRALEPFRDEFPNRYFNVGVAEQNMVGLATGLAEAGFLPFVYSIVTFATLRPYEFIRNGPVHQRLPVRIVGMGGGVEYGFAGPSHHGIEDVGAMRLLEGLTIVAPADHRQARTAIAATWRLDGPVYYRLGKNDVAEVAGLDGRFELGRVQMVRESGGVLVLAMGGIATVASEAVGRLFDDGIPCAFGVLAAVSPPPREHLAALLARYPVVVCVEAHRASGGLGSIVCEINGEHGLGCRVVRAGIDGMPAGITGSQAYLEARAGLSREALVARVREALEAGAPLRRRGERA